MKNRHRRFDDYIHIVQSIYNHIYREMELNTRDYTIFDVKFYRQQRMLYKGKTQGYISSDHSRKKLYAKFDDCWYQPLKIMSYNAEDNETETLVKARKECNSLYVYPKKKIFYYV